MNNSLSLLKVVNGISKTLNIANQMIPLYKQVKPLISNSGKVISSIKNFASNNNNKEYTKPETSTFTDTKPENTISYNSPTFFL